MPRLLKVAVTGFAALLGAGQPVSTDVAYANPAARMVILEVPDESLRDVAVAVYDPVHPVIYYNPSLMQRFSPELGAFFMAHEHAHIALKHTRASALGADLAGRNRQLQGKELEADCLAARQLGSSRRDASLAAVRFFARLGTMQFDDEHPTGTERARKILSCMPE
jgi:hypothetical protein